MSFAINPRKDLTRQVRRIAGRELDRMEKEFGVRGEAAHEAVHEARKRIKRLRGLYRLIRPATGSLAREEDERLGNVARSLSAVRDATALVETADKLAARFTDPADSQMLARLRGALIERRDRIAQAEIDLDAHLEDATRECKRARKSLKAIKLPASRSGQRELLVGSLKRSYGRIRDGFAKAKASGAAEDWHELRKLVKHHMMQVKLMRLAQPRTMRKRAEALDQLGESLGDDHDLAVLVALIVDVPIVAEADRERIAALAGIRTLELRDAAAGALEAMFLARPRDFAGRIRRRWRGA